MRLPTIVETLEFKVHCLRSDSELVGEDCLSNSIRIEPIAKDNNIFGSMGAKEFDF